ncbi:MAG: cellulose binding domain-containing protein [Pseudomonadota bacterium]
MNTVIRKFLKKSLTVAGLCSVALPSAAVWTIQNGKILDPNGQPFIFRGITVNHTAAPDKAVQAIKDAAAAGANAVQVEISANVYNQTPRITPEQLSSVIQACKDNKVVCVLEPNDIAGYPNAAGSSSPDPTLAFWGYQGRQAIAGQQDYVIIGMGNQALGDIPYGEYSARMLTYLGNYISALPGFLIMIDGSGWGQDASKEMQAFAAQNTYFAKNVIYSVEMSGTTYADPAKVHDYIASFPRSGAALVIGSFAPAPYYHPYAPQPTALIALQLPAASVMEAAEQYGVGYFAWNWSGSTNPGLNLTTDWDAAALTHWGELAINGANGIKATAKRATHFSNNSSSVASSISSSLSSTSSSNSSAPNSPPSAVLTARVQNLGCPRVSGIASAEGSTDPDGDTLTYSWEVTSSFNGSTNNFSGSGISIQFGMQAIRVYNVKLTVSDGKGGIATASESLSHAFSDWCINSSSSSSWKPSSSSIAPSSSSRPSSVSSSSVTPSSISSSIRSSSSIAAKASCAYVIGSQWGNGFTAAIRVKNTGTQTLNGWSVNWRYNDGSKVTGSWNATMSGSNPYTAKNVGWNANIQPGQTVEFGFQGSKPAGTAAIPVVTGSVCQ